MLAGTFAGLAGCSNLPRVDVIYGCAGMPVDLVRYSIERSAGIVLAGMGNGSMPDAVRHELRQAIASGAGIEVIEASARQAGMISLFEHGCMAVEQGLTTIEELVRVLGMPDGC